MHTHETDQIIAIQPETDIEQSVVAEMFYRLLAVSDAPDHPEKIGNDLVYYTLDFDGFDGLDHDLAEEAEIDVDEHGRVDPEPGSRALVVTHNPVESVTQDDETVVDPDDIESRHATEEDIDDAVENLAEGEDEDNEYTVDPEAVADEIEAIGLDDLDVVDYRQLQAWAQDISTTGVLDIPANQSADDIAADIETFLQEMGRETEVDHETE